MKGGICSGEVLMKYDWHPQTEGWWLGSVGGGGLEEGMLGG